MTNESDPGPPGRDVIVEPADSLPELTMDTLPRSLQEAARRAGWSSLMPVQARAIPYLLTGRDVMVQSRTGTGKTGAFVLPILDRIDPNKNDCQALVLVPTRELARQVTSEAEKLAGDSGVRTVSLYGGVRYGPQLDGLRKGAHLVVGTPGRILDHLMRGTLNLRTLRILVFDEADRMLSMGFYPDMRELREYLPSRRNGYMFSATFPPRVRYLAGEFLDNPGFLSLSHDAEYVVETAHVYYEVPAMNKERSLVRVIEVVNPDSAIVFCNTKDATRFVSVVLKRFGYDADLLSSELSQRERDEVLARVYRQKLRFLVATDVAARGIDITGLSHVFLYDFPDDPESYIHRTGRTGRAGAAGEAISLVTVLEGMELKRVAKRYNIDMEQRKCPTDEDVREVVAERAIALLEAKLRGLDGLVRERLERMIPLARRLGENEDEVAILAMLIDEHYHAAVHKTPPPIEVPPEAAPPRSGFPPDDERKRKPRRRRGRRRD